MTYRVSPLVGRDLMGKGWLAQLGEQLVYTE